MYKTCTGARKHPGKVRLYFSAGDFSNDASYSYNYNVFRRTPGYSRSLAAWAVALSSHKPQITFPDAIYRLENGCSLLLVSDGQHPFQYE